MSKSDKKQGSGLEYVHSIRPDMSIDWGKFKTAQKFLESYLMDDAEKSMGTTQLSARIPSHLNDVLASNAKALGITKTELVVSALEIGLNDIIAEFEKAGVNSGYKES